MLKSGKFGASLFHFFLIICQHTGKILHETLHSLRNPLSNRPKFSLRASHSMKNPSEPLLPHRIRCLSTHNHHLKNPHFGHFFLELKIQRRFCRDRIGLDRKWWLRGNLKGFPLNFELLVGSKREFGPKGSGFRNGARVRGFG